MGRSPLMMKRSGMHWWLVTVLGVLSRSAQGAGSCSPPERGPAGCPPGEEPTGDPAGTCRACPPGTFSLGDASCAAHTQCGAGNRILVAAGTAASDSRCGACLPGFHSPGGEREPRGRCLPCAAAPRGTPGCPGGCSSRRCHPGAGGDGGACAGPRPGDATRDLSPPRDGARCPAGMWQLRTPLLVTHVASASLVQGSWGNGI